MKNATILALAFVLGSASLMANNLHFLKIPPTNQTAFEEERIIEEVIFEKNKLLKTNVLNNNKLVKMSLSDLKKLQEDFKLEAIKNYANLMPDIIGKE